VQVAHVLVIEDARLGIEAWQLALDQVEVVAPKCVLKVSVSGLDGAAELNNAVQVGL